MSQTVQMHQRHTRAVCRLGACVRRHSMVSQGNPAAASVVMAHNALLTSVRDRSLVSMVQPPCHSRRCRYPQDTRSCSPLEWAIATDMGHSRPSSTYHTTLTRLVMMATCMTTSVNFHRLIIMHSMTSRCSSASHLPCLTLKEHLWHTLCWLQSLST